MSYTSSDHIKTGRYFKVASGYVPNQFSVRIIKEGVVDQESGAGGNPLYLLNLEPWVIEQLTLPQIQFNVKNDIYMDAESLIQPDYVASVQTTGEIVLQLREKSDLAIHRSLIRCQKEFYNSLYEGKGSLGEQYSVIVNIKSQRLDDNASNSDEIFGDNQIIFGRAIITSIENPTYSHSENKFLKYTVRIQVNCMAETYSLLGRNNMKKFKQSVGSVLGTASSTQSNGINPNINNSFGEGGILSSDRKVSAKEAERLNSTIEARKRNSGNTSIGGVDYGDFGTMDSDRSFTLNSRGEAALADLIGLKPPTYATTATGDTIPFQVTDPRSPLLPTAPAMIKNALGQK